MRRNSDNIPIIIGVIILACVAFGLSGIAYSFYRSQMAEEQEKSADLANNESPFEQLKREKNIVITPVPEEFGGSVGIDIDQEGIPLGTYSNPPASINPSGSSEYINKSSSPHFSEGNNNSLDSDSESLTDEVIDYSRPSSSNNFHRASDNSLIDPLEDDDFLATPSSTVSEPPTIQAPPLSESKF